MVGTILSIKTVNAWGSIKYVLVVSIFLFLIWVVSRLVIKMTKKTTTGRQIDLIDRISVAQDSYVYIVRIKGINYVIAQNKGGITLIDKREEEIPGFDEVLQKKVYQAEESFLTKQIKKIIGLFKHEK